MTDVDREVLFKNEAFLIGMLQVVSAGSIVAILSQAGVVIQYAGILSFNIFITLMVLSLISALAAAYCRHDYKMWDVKFTGSLFRHDHKHLYKEKNESEQHAGKRLFKEAQDRSALATKNLVHMRRAMLFSALSIIIAFISFVVFLWIYNPT